MDLFNALVQRYISDREVSGRPLSESDSAAVQDLLARIGVYMDGTRVKSVELLAGGNAEVTVVDAAGRQAKFDLLSRGAVSLPQTATQTHNTNSGISITGRRTAPHSYSNTPDKPQLDGQPKNVANEKLTPSKPVATDAGMGGL